MIGRWIGDNKGVVYHIVAILVALAALTGAAGLYRDAKHHDVPS